MSTSSSDPRSTAEEGAPAAPVPPELAAALRRAAEDPSNEPAWEALETLAGELQRPEEVADLQLRLLERADGAVLAASMGRRALRFREEWFGDDPGRLVALLERVLALDPTLDWAFERLTLLYSVAQRWDELLALYDRALAALPAKEIGRRRKLLQEAAGVAKDFYGDADRAIRYLQELFDSRPGDPHAASALERLLERQGQWEVLARVWAQRLEHLEGGEALELRARLATLRLEKLGDASTALQDARTLLDGDAADAAAGLRVLEQVLTLESAPAAARRQALVALRAYHMRDGSAQAEERIIAALRAALTFAEADEKVALRREIVERLHAQGATRAALEELVELARALPTDAGVRLRLKHMAELAGAPAWYPRGLRAAADTTSDDELRAALRLHAAEELERLGDTEAARTLFEEIESDDRSSPDARLTAVRGVTRLLAQAPVAADARLAALERRARAEVEPEARRGAWAEVARFASKAAAQQPEGDGRAALFDRAVNAWEQRLGEAADDQLALDGLVATLEQAGRPDALTVALQRRILRAPSEAQRRADLARVAELGAGVLGEPGLAIDAWLEVQRRFGDDDREAAGALRTLLARAGRWDELEALLTALATREQSGLIDVYRELGHIAAVELEPAQWHRAAGWFERVLQLDPRHAEARAGLQAVLAGAEAAQPPEAEAARAATQALWRAYGDAGEPELRLALLDRKLSATAVTEQAALLKDAAGWAEARPGGAGAALTLLARALPLAPQDLGLDAALTALGERLGETRLVVNAWLAAAAALPADSARALELRVRAAQRLEGTLADEAGAMAAYEAVFAAVPAHATARAGLVRIRAQRGAWDDAVMTALQEPVSRTLLEAEVLPLLEAAAGAHAAWPALAGATANAIARLSAAEGLPVDVARALELRSATWLDNASAPDEATLAQAEAALLRVVALDAAAGQARPALERLAEVQRRRAPLASGAGIKATARALVDTLLRLAAHAPDELDALAEAADLVDGPLALAPVESADVTLARRVHRELLDRAAHRLRTGAVAPGTRTPEACALRSIDALASAGAASGQRAEIAAAIDVLLDGTHLPLPLEATKSLRRRAATLALEGLGDRARARELYRRVVEDEPNDVEALRTLDRLYEEAELLSELIALKRRQLALAANADERLRLRLDVARIAGTIEERAARVETLLANLEEQPGHAPTLASLGALLLARGKASELGDILAAQARRLEEAGPAQRAAELWAEVAALAESTLHDAGRAITAYERVAALAPTTHAIDALARLYDARQEPLTAATWLEQRLGMASDAEDRVAVALRLGQAYLSAGQRHRAIASLERALTETPTAHAVRGTLIELYRQAGSWEALARTLADGSALLPATAEGRDTLAAYAREAATLYLERLGAPERAIPVLERAVAQLPADRWLRSALAEGLRVAGRFAEARAALQGLLDEMGRRRSKERASIHHQLGLVARAMGDPSAAIEHLEQAAAIDVDNQSIVLMLAEVAEEAADFERAERALRALLVLARRSEPEMAVLSASETLLRLERVARRRGQNEAAAECLDSALAAALQSAGEARRLQRALIDRGDVELALELIERRRAAAAGPGDEGQILAEQGEALATIGRKPEALRAYFSALEHAPEVAATHERARALAVELGHAAEYLGLLKTQLDHRRRWDDAPRVADLLLRAGAVAEVDLHDLNQAVELYTRAEQTGARAVEALTALARVTSELGDSGAAAHALHQLTVLGEAEGASSAERADVWFRIAALELSSGPARLESGLDALAKALGLEADFARAMDLVRTSGVPDHALVKVMPLYERVARASGDDRMLLDFLERRAAAPDVSPDDVREGVELALALGDGPRAEALLVRTVELARARAGGLQDAAWALLDLAQRRRTAGDLVGATAWLEQAATVTDSPRVPALLRDIAREAATQPAQGALAARIYEDLRGRNPTDRTLWEPLLVLYRQSGDRARLARVVDDTLSRLADRSERNLLRMEWARFLAPDGGHSNEDDELATTVLRDVLLDEPAHRDALLLLADVQERRGEVGEAVTLLSEALRDSEGRGGDEAWRQSTGRRLAQLLQHAEPSLAKTVYRAMLSTRLGDAGLRRHLQESLRALLSDAGEEARERADLAEHMLADDVGDAAADAALALADARLALGEGEAAVRALELGRAKAPAHRALFTRLAQTYETRGDWRRLASLLADEAERRDEPHEIAALWAQEAAVASLRLGDHQRAAERLRRATALVPHDLRLVRELAASLSALGDGDGAIDEVTRALAHPERSTEARADLLRLRAELRGKNREEALAVRDLEEAVTLAGPPMYDPLIEALFRWAARSAEEGDIDAERRALFRLAEIWAERGENDRAQDLLFRWIEQHPEDEQALRALRERFERNQRWDEVAQVCARLLALETGPARIDAALGLAVACERLGRSEDALGALEPLWQEYPGEPSLLRALARIYETLGDQQKLARLLVDAADRAPDEESRFRSLVEGAQILLRLGDPVAAFAALERAARFRPKDRAVRRLLADASLAAGMWAEAAEVVGALIADSRGVDPAELAELHHRLSRAAAGQGDRAGQLMALRRALDIDRKNGEVAAEIADIAEDVGDDDLALKALRTITLHAPRGPMTPAVAFYRQARIAARQGDKQRAIIFAKRALQENPQLDLAEELLRELR